MANPTAKTPKQTASKYFWALDHEVPRDILREYGLALESKPSSAVSSIVRLLSHNVPMPPRAYLTSAFFQAPEKRLPEDFFAELSWTISRLEHLSFRQFGGRDNPLLLTVQGHYSGSIRNIGCSLTSLRAMIHHYGAATAYTFYVDFLEGFSTLVLGCPPVDFRRTFGIEAHREGGAGGLALLSEEEFARKVKEYQNLVSQKVQKPFPDTVEKQLLATLMHCGRVGRSSPGEEIQIRCQIPRSVDSRSGQGLAYTRNPFTGNRDLYGVYQQGGSEKKIPLELSEAQGTSTHSGESLRALAPSAYTLLKRFLPEIEAAYRDIVEAEFVIDSDGQLFFTGFDKAQATTRAAVTAAMALNLDGKLSDREAALRIKPKDIEVLLHPTLDNESRGRLQDTGSTGVTAAPGTSVGHVFFLMSDAMDFYRSALKNKQDKRVILIANELLISDTPGLGIIDGLVTKASGIASHAAVMARANGIPCIVGLPNLEIAADSKSATINGKRIAAGTMMTLEAGSTGRLFFGEGKLQNPSFQEGIIKDVSQLISRVIKAERIPMEVRVNINSAKDAQTGLFFGADGVGLCRTENMFMEPHALREIRNIVFSRDPALCSESLRKLEETQFQDFVKIFQVMKDRTVNIRLMDLPLHDFVPQRESDFEELAKDLRHLDMAQIRAVAEELREHNPMLGLRACRFGLITPEVYKMQIRAITRAAYTVAQSGTEVRPGIMFPLVFLKQELARLRAMVLEIENHVREEMKIPYGTKIRFKVGSMIELPAAALSTDQLATIGEFFAFGTNDLTQTTLGMSRDDSAHYLPAYIEKGILGFDPFKVLAPPVKELIEFAVSRGHHVRGDASFGICGEQGGDPMTLKFCLEKGLNYVSASPFRVLPTRIALVHIGLGHKAAQAAHAAQSAEAPKAKGAAAA